MTVIECWALLTGGRRQWLL